MSAKNDFGLFFKRHNVADDLVYRLPVNPEKIPVSQDSANEEYNVLGIGPIMVPRIPNLKKVTIESYFPGRIDRMTLTSGDFRPPEFYINFFRSAMANKEVLIYAVSRCYEDGTPYFVNDPGIHVYFYSSYGDKPSGSGNGRRVVVSRIINDDNDRPYPVHVKSESGGALGWCKKGDLQGVDTQ